MKHDCSFDVPILKEHSPVNAGFTGLSLSRNLWRAITKVYGDEGQRPSSPSAESEIPLAFSKAL